MGVELLSCRSMLSLFGFAGAILAIPSGDTEAQTSGMERCQERRSGRVERRYERRGGRTHNLSLGKLSLRRNDQPGRPTVWG
jgi:hypothetical protein